jgi:hypothetical protein
MKNDADAQAMEDEEREILAALGLSRSVFCDLNAQPKRLWTTPVDRVSSNA